MEDTFRFQKESETVTKTFYYKLEKELNTEINRIIESIKKQIPQKMQAIKSEILGSYQMIATTTVQKVFIETYGENYDVESLNASLTLGLGNNLRPIFLYD